MEYSTHLAIAFGLLSLVYYLYTLTLPRPLGHIPYERHNVRRPFGDMPGIVRLGRETGSLSPGMFDIARRLNTPLAQVLTPGFVQPFLVLNDPRECEDILLRRNREFDRSPTTTRLFAPLVPHSTLAQLTTPALRAQKRLWADAMNADFLRRAVAPNIHAAALDLIELWTLRAALTPDLPISVSRDFNHAALDAIWVAVLGSHPGITRRAITDLSPTPSSPPSPDALRRLRSAAVIEAAMESAHHLVHASMNSVLSRLTILRIRLSPTFRRFSATLDAEIRRLMTESVARLATEKTETDTCAMDLVLRRALRQDPPPRDPTTDPAMLEELLLLLMAGHDSTANTLGWFVKLMASHQEVQARLREAVRRLPEGVDAAGILDANVPYLDAVMEETARVSGTAAVVARQAVVETTVLGYRVPKGANVLLNTHIMEEPGVVEEGVRSMTSQAAQGRRGRGGLEGEAGRGMGEFRPERWLVVGEEGEEVFDGNALPGLIFGGGLRGCFGKRLAMQELRIFIFHLMYNFEFLPLPEELQDMSASERIFRQPNMCHVRLRKL
ncbi:cytochrome P450 [Schizothecium vesticola]|uniref:Cytochrome P450 n=1 Tax=Schizothecium vesticola TaxID=314040 RepID=A0AA40K9R5_9PEZI|nr:cytochrome P450 [Schizothecium vesticola]